jgi:hypothetical protein
MDRPTPGWRLQRLNRCDPAPAGALIHAPGVLSEATPHQKSLVLGLDILFTFRPNSLRLLNIIEIYFIFLIFLYKKLLKLKVKDPNN